MRTRVTLSLELTLSSGVRRGSGRLMVVTFRRSFLMKARRKPHREKNVSTSLDLSITAIRSQILRKTQYGSSPGVPKKG